MKLVQPEWEQSIDHQLQINYNALGHFAYIHFMLISVFHWS